MQPSAEKHAYFLHPDSASYYAMMKKEPVNWSEVFEKLCKKEDVRFTPEEKRFFAILYTPYHKVKRFGREQLLEEDKKDSNAEHSIGAALEACALLKQQGITDATLRTDMVRKLLLHDVGEMLGELATNMGQDQGASITKATKDEMEDMVFKHVANLACGATFDANLRPIVHHSLEQAQAQTFAALHSKDVLPVMKQALNDMPLCTLNDDGKQLYEQMLTAYQQVEHPRSFMDMLAKQIEKTQATSLICTHEQERTSGMQSFSSREAHSAVQRVLYNAQTKHMAALYDHAHTEQECMVLRSVNAQGFLYLAQSTELMPPIYHHESKVQIPLVASTQEGREAIRSQMLQENMHSVTSKRVTLRGRDRKESFMQLFEGDAQGKHVYTSLELKAIFTVCGELGIIPSKEVDILGGKIPDMIPAISVNGKKTHIKRKDFIAACYEEFTMLKGQEARPARGFAQRAQELRIATASDITR